MDEKKRKRNEKEFDFWTEKDDGERIYWLKLLESWDGRLNI